MGAIGKVRFIKIKLADPLIPLIPSTDTALSAPFQKNLTAAQLQTPQFTAEHLIRVMSVLEKEDSGKLFDFEGFPFQP